MHVVAKEMLVKISKLTRLGFRWSALALGVFALAALSNPPASTKQQASLLSPDVTRLMAVYGAEAVSLDRNSRDYKLPDQIEWKGSKADGLTIEIVGIGPATSIQAETK